MSPIASEEILVNSGDISLKRPNEQAVCKTCFQGYFVLNKDQEKSMKKIILTVLFTVCNSATFAANMPANFGSCPSGWLLQGSTCSSNSAALVLPSNYGSCPSGFTLWMRSQCYINRAGTTARANFGSCPNGFTAWRAGTTTVCYKID